MKKLIYMLLLLFVMPLIGLSQNDSINNSEQHHYKKQTSIDINLLGIGINETKPINEKYAFIYGIESLMIYVPIDYDKNFNYDSAIFNLINLSWGITVYSTKKWYYIGVLKFGMSIPFFLSSYGGVSFKTFYKITSNSSIGTNIEIGLIKYDNSPLIIVGTPFITYRIRIGR